MEYPWNIPEWEGRSLKEVSEVTGDPEDTLIRKAIHGELSLWVWYPHTGAECEIPNPNLSHHLPFCGWAKIQPDAVKQLLSWGELDVFNLLLPNQKKGAFSKHFWVFPLLFTNNKYRRNAVRIMPVDLARLIARKPTSKTTPPIRKPGIKNRLTFALENARAILIGKNKKEPATQEVIAFLKQDDPSGAVIDYGKGENGPYLEWEDQRGNHHRTTHKSIANTMTKIRKENNKLL